MSQDYSQKPSVSRDEILAAYTLESVLDDLGIAHPAPGKLIKCPVHEDATPSFSIDFKKGVWFCHGCQRGGTAIDLIAATGNEDPKATYARLAKDLQDSSIALAARMRKSSPTSKKPSERSVATPPGVKATTSGATDGWPNLRSDAPVKTYPYRNLFGAVVYEVLRFERPNPAKESGKDKTFRQRHPNPAGGWVWSMEGVERVLYRLPEISAAPIVWVCEGEKDAENLVALGFCATCNVGGAGKWIDGYTESLSGKEIAICGDTDKPGLEHVEKVFESISKKAKSVRVIRIPEQFKDVSDYIASFQSPAAAASTLTALFDSTTPVIQGHKVPLFTFVELERQYISYVSTLEASSVNLGGWIAGLSPLRRLVPGDLVTFLAGTGVGKTSILANLAIHARPLSTLFFELELPQHAMFERFVGIKCGFSGRQTEQGYLTGDTVGEAALQIHFGHILICNEPRMSLRDLESFIIRSELKSGVKPKIVLLDYIQLLTGDGKSRYERASNVAEELKIIAKSTGTIVVIASQISRKSFDETNEVHLSDGKDSGSIENSSGVVIGVWRSDEDARLMTMRVLKATRGGAGTTVECDYDPISLRITQRPPSTTNEN